MNTETLTVQPNGANFEIKIRDNENGNIQTMNLPMSVYEQLRSHFVNDSIPTDTEIINNCPASCYSEREIWMRGVVWLKERVLKGNR